LIRILPQVFLVNPDGTTTELSSDGLIKDILKTEECYVLVADDVRKVFLWKGLKSSVRSKFIGAKRSQEIRGQVGMHYAVIPLDEADENKEFLKLIGGKTKNDGDGNFPSPYIFKPPGPPDDLALGGEPQAKPLITEQVLEYDPHCKYCGSNLSEGQSICHVCKNKVD